MIRSLRKRSLIAGVLASFAIVACGGERVTGPRAGPDAELIVSARVLGTPISTMVVEVSAEDISPSLIFNLVIVEGTARGTVKVPPGESRTFTIRALDEFGSTTHEGTTTRDIRPGQNDALTVVLAPRAGHVEIKVSFGSVGVAVTPTPLTLITGDAYPLTAVITMPDGQQITEAPDWATSNPTVASVTSDGVVKALAAGEVDIVATYAGVAGVSHITVFADIAFGSFTEFANGVDVSAGFLHSNPITVTEPITLTHLALFAKVAGPNVKMGLYTDLGGAPDRLVIGSEATSLAVGRVEIPVIPTQLSAGTYWIAAIYDRTANVGYFLDDTRVWALFQDFSSPLPNPFAFTANTAVRLNYYLKGHR